MDNNTLHKCRDCDRQIPSHIPVCIYCKSSYRKAGICWWCGERPVKPRARNGQQSQYCYECQHKEKELGFTYTGEERTIVSRGSELRGRRGLSPQQMAHLPDE